MYIYFLHIYFHEIFVKFLHDLISCAYILFLLETANEEDAPSSASTFLASKHALLESVTLRLEILKRAWSDTKRDTDSRHYRGYIPSYTRYLNPHGSLVSQRRDLIKTTQPTPGLEAAV